VATDTVTFCPFSYLEDEYQWIIESLQGQKLNDPSDPSTKYTSQIEKRKKKALCKEVLGTR